MKYLMKHNHLVPLVIDLAVILIIIGCAWLSFQVIQADPFIGWMERTNMQAIDPTTLPDDLMSQMYTLIAKSILLLILFLVVTVLTFTLSRGLLWTYMLDGTFRISPFLFKPLAVWMFFITIPFVIASMVYLAIAMAISVVPFIFQIVFFYAFLFYFAYGASFLHQYMKHRSIFGAFHHIHDFNKIHVALIITGVIALHFAIGHLILPIQQPWVDTIAIPYQIVLFFITLSLMRTVVIQK
ncbi:MAG: hypothetical protein ACMXYC_02335 [Candidatus Woesearchaeota archaeon]